MENIYIAVPSFKDKFLQSTIDDLFDQAAHPDRVYVGAFIQIDPNDGNGEALITNDYDGHVFYEYANAGTVLTIAGARLKSYQWLDSDYAYFFQIDAHSRFQKDWDIKIIEIYKRIQTEQKNKKILISGILSGWGYDSLVTPLRKDSEIHYILNKDEVYEWREKGIYIERPSFDTESSQRIFLESGNLTPGATWYLAQDKEYERGWFTFAAFLFGLVEYHNEVAIDPNVFNHSEEFLSSLQAFTHGWDVYHILDKPIYHLYKSPRHLSSTFRSTAQVESPVDYNINKMKSLQIMLDLVIYNKTTEYIGSDRTIQDLSNFIGYDLQAVFKKHWEAALSSVEEKIIQTQNLFNEFSTIEDKERAWRILYELFWAMFIRSHKNGG
jgi:hypothetical protein